METASGGAEEKPREPRLGWAALSRARLSKAEAQLLQQTEGVRDEVGVLALHTAYADRFFPGTSTQQRRLRYALFVPWQIVSLLRGRTSAVQARGELERGEIQLAKRLSGEEFGVIGVQNAANDRPVSIPPSSAYWVALREWGVLNTMPHGDAPSRQEMFGHWDKWAEGHRGRRVTDDEGRQLTVFPRLFVSGLPEAPPAFRGRGALDFRLRERERGFLRARLAETTRSCDRRPSLLAALASAGVDPGEGAQLWSPRIAAQADERDRRAIERARGAASLSAVARALYAAAVEALREHDGVGAGSDLHRHHLLSVVAKHGVRAASLPLEDMKSDGVQLDGRLLDVLRDVQRWVVADGKDPWNGPRTGCWRTGSAGGNARGRSCRDRRRAGTPDASGGFGVWRGRSTIGGGWCGVCCRTWPGADMGFRKTESLAVLEELVPRPGWRTDVALFSSYSADLVAVAAVAMALAAEGDDDERMWKGSLARSCEKMRGRFRVVCQGGRVAVPPPGAVSGLVVADQWVRQVPYDGNKRSWHAKLGIVRYVPEEADETGEQGRWLLWIGSRNLTRDTSWDSAMTATGRPSRTVDTADRSVAEAAGIVAGHAALPGWTEEVRQELSRVHWSWPADVDEVLAFRLWTDGNAAMGLPALPADSTRVVALCPFANAGVVQAIGGATSAPQRNLVTTPATLAKLAADRQALEAFTNVHTMESATPVEEGDAEAEETGTDEIVEVHRGLHAKLVWARSGSGDELWLGSANLTRRGWTGSNAELVAHLRVKASVGDGIADFVDELDDVAVEEVAVEDPEAEGDAEAALDELRNRIAGSWSGELSRWGAEGRLRCATPSPPTREDDGAELRARLLAQDAADAVAWGPGRREVEFAEANAHEVTELVVLELQWKADADVRVSWVERAPLNPPPGVERDRVALGRLMGPRALLAWIRSILDEFNSEAEESLWPERESTRVRGDQAGFALAPIPTLESVLRAWIRDPDKVSQVDRVLENWATAAKPALEEDEEAANALKRFQDAWGVVRDGLRSPRR